MSAMTRLAMLSMHTSPFAPLGVGHGGGMNVYVRELSEALATRGVEVDIFTASNDGNATVRDIRSRVAIHHIDIDKSGDRPIAEIVADFTDGVAVQLERLGGADVLHAHYWQSAWAAHRLKHDLGIPLVSTFHTLERVKAEAGITDEEANRAQVENDIIGCSDVVVASNLIEASDIRRLYNSQSTIEIVHPGIDTATFKPGEKDAARRQLGLELGKPIALFAGRIQNAKGLDRAVDAFRQVVAMHPDAELIVIGGPSGLDGNEALRAVHRRVNELHLQNHVRFVGPRPRNELALFYQAADLVVVPSRTESFGLVALEAAASSTPVVASARGGLQFVVEHGRTGFLTNDIDELAGAMDHLFAEPEKAKAFGHVAAERATSFTWQATASRMAQIYRSLETGANANRVSSDCLTA